MISDHEVDAESRVPRLRIVGLSKTFGGARALDEVSLSVMPGEIHGLIGQNGSGKSTLIKILAGFHTPDDGSGTIEIDGQPLSFPVQSHALRELGLAFVHQDLGLVPSMSVVENLRVDEIAESRHRFRIPWKEERERARRTFQRFGFELPPNVAVERLDPIDRARLAIVRAVERVAPERPDRTRAAARGLLVLDEPTAFLPYGEAEHLFQLMRQIAASGASVIFVSHDIDEVRSITDRVSVLRDGRNAGTGSTADLDEPQLIEMIIGRRLEALPARERVESKPGRKPVLSVEGLHGRYVADFALEVGASEIVGLTGVVGSGFDEVPALLFGAKQARSGAITIGDASHEVAHMNAERATQLGCALVPADRQTDGSIGSLSVADNVMLQVLDQYRGPLGLRRRKMRDDCAALLERVEIRPNRPTMLYQSLSGGNQQKALLAKWLQTNPRLLLLQEPTQGVDVGARQQIYTLLRDAARDGLAIVCASSDHEQLAAICNRVLIFADGRVVAELEDAEITKDALTQHSISMRSA